MENMNNQGKTPQQYKDSTRFAWYGVLGMIILLILTSLLMGCTTTKKCCEETHKPGDITSNMKWGDLKPIFKNNESERSN